MKKKYQCSACQATFSSWYGICSQCQQWGSILPLCEVKKSAVTIESLSLGNLFKIKSNSCVLLYGKAGVGKTTLLLKWLKEAKFSSLYISTEQSVVELQGKGQLEQNEQHKLHFERKVESIVGQINGTDKKLIVIDSIQGIVGDHFLAARSKAFYQRELIDYCLDYAKENNKSFVFVSYVNKEGELRGSYEIAHGVDVVLKLTHKNKYRYLEIDKNRFGQAGIRFGFIMNEQGQLLDKNTSN